MDGERLEENQSFKLQYASKALQEMAITITSLSLTLITFHKDIAMQDLVAWAIGQSTNDGL